MKQLNPKESGQPNKSGERSSEPNSQNEAMNRSEAVLEAQLRECFGRVVYSHKTHEKCADILLSRLSTIKVWQIALSAVTTGGFLSSFFGSGEVGAVIGVIVSTALLVLNAYTKNYDLGELAQKHRGAAADLWLIREQYLTLLTDLRGASQPLTQIMSARDTLLKDLHTVYTGAPSTTFQAYKKAQEALQRFEDLTFSDSEIDAFLPSELKKAKGGAHQPLPAVELTQAGDPKP